MAQLVVALASSLCRVGRRRFKPRPNPVLLSIAFTFKHILYEFALVVCLLVLLTIKYRFIIGQQVEKEVFVSENPTMNYQLVFIFLNGSAGSGMT